MKSRKHQPSSFRRVALERGKPHRIRPNEVSIVSEESAVVAEPIEATVKKRRAKREKKPKRQPPYHVILWDDNDHSYAYVMAMMLEVFRYPLERGYQIAKEVDTQGRVIVATTTKEHAELKRDQIHAYGKDDLIAGCKGSMSATIEAAE